MSLNWQVILDRPIAFHRIFSRITGSVNAGLMLSQGFYWSGRTGSNNGWFWKTQEEWEEETTLTRRQQETAREILRSKGFFKEEFRGIPRKLWFKLDIDAVENAILEYQNKTLVTLLPHKNAIMQATETPCSISQNSQAIHRLHTETTTKTTSKKKKREEKIEPTLFDIESTVIEPHFLPSTFTVSPNLLEWAKTHVEGIDIYRETDKFRDHFTSKPKKYTDWPAAWRNWMRNAYKWEQERKAKQQLNNPSVNKKVAL